MHESFICKAGSLFQTLHALYNLHVDPEYMKMKLKIIPQEIIDQYQLQDLEEDGWVYMNIVKGMPGLKQAACLANEILVHHLAPYGYSPVHNTPSL